MNLFTGMGAQLLDRFHCLYPSTYRDRVSCESSECTWKYLLKFPSDSAIVAFPLLLALFTLKHPPSAHKASSSAPRPRYIPSQLLPPDIDPRSALLDKDGAIFHTTLLLVTLATLVGTSFVKHGKVEVWMVTMPAGLIAFFRDIWSERKKPNVKETEEIEMEVPTQPVVTPNVKSSRRLSLPYLVDKTCKRFPTTTSTISRLPLSLLLFAGGVFVLSRGLTTLGWTSVFAGWLAKICVNPAATVFFVGSVSRSFHLLPKRR